MKEVTYGRTPLGQLLYDLAFSKLSERYLARKYRLPIAEIRKLRNAARMGLEQGIRERRVKP
jgi:hypothetical protein